MLSGDLDEREWNKMRKEILKRVKPSTRFHLSVKKTADDVVEKLNSLSPDNIEVMLTGSFAKGTYIKDDVDFDVFILFPESYSIDELESMAFEWGKQVLETWEVAYAQHPYLRGTYKGHRVDIVPSYKLKGKDIAHLKSAVDRTQFHTKYVLSNITESQKDDVRILKVFLKRLGIYGAEIRTGGFSGYLCELLVMHSGSFYNLIKSSREWKFPVAIDMVGRKSSRLLSTLFKGDALIVIDPVDKRRNVAAPVSDESLARFVAASHIFFMKPSTSAFFETLKPMSLQDIRKNTRARGTHFILFKFTKPDKVNDILWGELRRTLKNIRISFECEHFECVHQTAEVSGDECFLLFELMFSKLPNISVQEGPYVRMGRHLESFIREEINNVDLFVCGERLCAVRKRKFSDVKQLVKDIQANPIKHGISKGLLKEIKSSSVFYGKDCIFASSADVFTKHLNRRFFLGL